MCVCYWVSDVCYWVSDVCYWVSDVGGFSGKMITVLRLIVSVLEKKGGKKISTKLKRRELF